MDKQVTVKISREARAIAQEAAKKEGMKLYAWIEKAIMEKGGKNEI